SPVARAGAETSVPSSTSTSCGARARPASAGRSRSPLAQPTDETMTDLLPRPYAETNAVQPLDDSLAERLLTTQSPQRPQSTPRIRIEVDGPGVGGVEGPADLRGRPAQRIE